MPFVEETIAFYYNTYLQKGEPMKPLLSGHRVMEILGLSPGPQVGRVLSSLLDAQLEGEVSTKEEAERWVKELVNDRA